MGDYSRRLELRLNGAKSGGAPRRSARMPESPVIKQKPGKGVRGENCNRTACQGPGATWYNFGSLAWYCRHCADLINRESRRMGEGNILFHLSHSFVLRDREDAGRAWSVEKKEWVTDESYSVFTLDERLEYQRGPDYPWKGKWWAL